MQNSHLRPEARSARRSRAFREAGDQTLALVSQIILNGSFFLVVLLASIKLEPSEFLKVAFANSLIPLIATGLDFGLNQSCLALSFEHKKQDYVALNLMIKAAIVALALAILGLAFALSEPSSELILIVAGASMSFWTATRVIDQYERRFRQYALFNIALAGARVAFGLVALTFNRWIVLIFALHVLSQVPIQILSVTKNRHLRLNSIDWGSLYSILRMAPITFISAGLFSSLPLITLWLLNTKTDTHAAAAFGVVLMFLAPVDLVFLTLKVYVFPKIIETEFKKVDIFGLGQNSMYLIMIGLAAILAISIIPAGFIVDQLYDKKFPEAGSFFRIYFSCHALGCVIGLYNLQSQRPGFVRLLLIANMFRAGATALIVTISGISSYQIVLWSGIIIVLGEFVLAALLMRAPNPERTTGVHQN